MTPEKLQPLVLSLLLLVVLHPHGCHGEACEPLKMSTCSGVGYNLTRLPNLVGDHLQSHAEGQVNAFDTECHFPALTSIIFLQLETYAPLIQSGCAAELRFLLCSVYAPLCVPDSPQALIGPCRPLCLRVRQRCEPVLSGFGYSWQINCTAFPAANGRPQMCMDGPGEGNDG